MKQKYKATKGASFGNKQAQVIGETLSNLDVITPEKIIEEAKKEDSPIHEFFEWDDSEAAVKYRLVQARQLTCHVMVTIEHNNEEIEVRAFHSIKDEGKKFYVTTVDVMENEDYKSQLVGDMIKSLETLTYKMKLFRDKL